MINMWFNYDSYAWDKNSRVNKLPYIIGTIKTIAHKHIRNNLKNKLMIKINTNIEESTLIAVTKRIKVLYH